MKTITMKNQLSLINRMILPVLVGIFSTVTSQADQRATIKCVGEKITLIESSPYLGENSPNAQSLFTIMQNDSDGSKNTIFFLLSSDEVESDIGPDFLFYTGSENQQGGHFLLKTAFWKNIGHGDVIKEETTGTLTYAHGPLAGTDEAVKCIKD